MFPNVRLASQCTGTQELIINMINNDLTTHESINKIDYTETRNIPYLSRPNDYYLTVTKFNLETAGLLPVFIPIIQPNQPDVNKTVYEFQLEYSGVMMSINVEYIAQDKTISAPSSNVTASDGSGINKYYYVYSYQWFINMLNAALKQLIDSFNASLALPSVVYPFFEFDTKTSLINLNLPYQYYDASALNPIKLYCNNPLSILLSTIMMTKSRISGKKWHYFYPTSTVTKSINSQVYYVLNQESTSIGLLNPVASIAFTTSGIPINPASSTPAVKFGTDIQNVGRNNNAGTSNIICEFSVPMGNGNTYLNTIDYKPAFLNYIDLFGDSPLKQIQIGCAWKDKFANFNQIELASGCSCSITLVFVRRDFWNMNLK